MRHIIHASCIQEANIISEADATKIWHQKRSASPKQLKIIFAGRLHPSKGVLVLLEAMKILDEQNIAVKLGILGEGELLSNCQAASFAIQKIGKNRNFGNHSLQPRILRAAATRSCCCVPSIREEQPRIVYDAYSLAVSVLANNTAGLRDCIENGITGSSIANCDRPAALANLLKQSKENLNQLQNMGSQPDSSRNAPFRGGSFG